MWFRSTRLLAFMLMLLWVYEERDVFPTHHRPSLTLWFLCWPQMLTSMVAGTGSSSDGELSLFCWLLSILEEGTAPLWTNIWKVTRGPKLTYLTRDKEANLVHLSTRLGITKLELSAHKQRSGTVERAAKGQLVISLPCTWRTRGEKSMLEPLCWDSSSPRTFPSVNVLLDIFHCGHSEEPWLFLITHTTAIAFIQSYNILWCVWPRNMCGY